jgi:exodeoxyribonuclease V alpha subunit
MNEAAQHLAQGFAHHVALWARRRGCDAATIGALRAAAAELSLATSEGHVCLKLDATGGPADAAALRGRLLSSGLVGRCDAAGALPLVLDDDGRLYLNRYFDAERRLARRLVRAAIQSVAPASEAALALVDELFAANQSRLAGGVDWQKAAAVLALRSKLVIISGGPGTGKTSTVVNLLAGLLEQDPALRIALAAPTGKARARLIEAIQQKAGELPARFIARFPAGASTIHRLLGARGDGTYRHHPGNPLPVDVLVVDEASMLDLALATRLLEAVPDEARIILLGDKDQLASVESGAVFAEISARQGVLADSVVWFRDNFRFAGDGGLARLAADISGARTEAALAGLRDDAETAVTWRSEAAGDAAGGYDLYVQAVRDGRDHRAVLNAFGAYRILCAVREGPRGVAAVNAHVEAHLRAGLQADPAAPWYPGRAVVVTRNDYVLDLMNGDVGVALMDESGELAVYFADGAQAVRAIAPARLPPHEPAFATTVHKAQGSEFDTVMVILPDKPAPVVTRELLYTAVTRARERVILCAAETVLRAAIDAPTRRHSGLAQRLAEAAKSPVPS